MDFIFSKSPKTFLNRILTIIFLFSHLKKDNITLSRFFNKYFIELFLLLNIGILLFLDFLIVLFKKLKINSQNLEIEAVDITNLKTNFITKPEDFVSLLYNSFNMNFLSSQDSKFVQNVYENYNNYLFNFFKILIFFCVALFVAMLLTTVANLLSRSVKSRRTHSKKALDFEKISAYECGFEPFEDARNSFDVNFYLVALLFILFDLEIVFLFPWCLFSYFCGFFEYKMLLIFIYILTLGFVYEWKKGALEWY